MVKGGFQGLDITGVDLTAQSPTLPGAYATCAGADGKPIRVQTAGGIVECSVKKVSTNYVLAGITGDGKILSITIGSTDGISVNESVPGEEPEEYLDNGVNIASYTSSSPYTVGYDGLVTVVKSSTGDLSANFALGAKVGSTHQYAVTLLNILANAPANTAVVCFVKKGTIIYCASDSSGVIVKFWPYKPVES